MTGTCCTAGSGFTQYQCVLPRDAGAHDSRRLLEVMTRHRVPSRF